MFPKDLLCFADDEAFGKFFENSSFDLAHALLVFRHMQEVEWSCSICLCTFLYCFADGSLDHAAAFTALVRKGNADGQAFPCQNLLTVSATILWEDYVR